MFFVLIFVFYQPCIQQHPVIRIKKLYHMMKLPIPSRNDIKKEAKLAKGFMVMVKAKLNKDVLCRSVPFRRLMSLVFHDDEEKEVWSQDKRLG